MLREILRRYRFGSISTEQFRELAAAYMPPKSGDRTLEGFFRELGLRRRHSQREADLYLERLKTHGNSDQGNVADDFSAFVPVEVQAARQKTVYWLPTGSDPYLSPSP